jgi:ribose transport system ATP-binding protein
MPVKPGGFIDFKKLYLTTQEYLNFFDTSIKPSSRTDTLNVAEQQIVEIAKAISMNCKLLILDEPTSSLSDKETENLFKLLKRLKSEDIGILYISHRMPEIFNLCDRVTILRDGEWVETLQVENTTERDVICKMVGRTLLENLYPPKAKKIEQNILEINEFSRHGVFSDIGFSLRKGEILGLAGLVGAGRSEIARAICGIDKRDSGNTRYNGENLHITNYSDALNHGICYLTENRKEEGLFLGLPIKENVSVSILKRISNNLFISKKQEADQTKDFIAKLRIKISSINDKAESLSGGNQQKVVIAKWLAIDPKIIIMDEPTRGIDVGAKSEIHKMIRELSDSGIGIIIISSEMPEIIGMCDRVLVLHEGRIMRELAGKDITEKNIIIGASGHLS